MDFQKDKISITIQVDEINFQITTYKNEYRSLMQLIKDNTFLEDFGECGGVGRCCTCIITILSDKNKIPMATGIEINSLVKNNLDPLENRLSCQILIDKNHNNLKIKI